MSKNTRLFYNVYDNGELILENASRKEILDKIGNAPGSVTQYTESGHKFMGRYTFKVGVDPREKSEELSELEKAWAEAVRPFKNVIWVKEGGRKLVVRGKK